MNEVILHRYINDILRDQAKRLFMQNMIASLAEWLCMHQLEVTEWFEYEYLLDITSQ